MRTDLNCSLGLLQPEGVITMLGEIKLWHGIEWKSQKRLLKDISLLP